MRYTAWRKNGTGGQAKIMSDDLIRRQAIKSQIETIRDCWRISPFVSSSDMKLYEKAFNVVLTTISDCHTAFDKEKVMGDLNDWMKDAEKQAAKYDEFGDIDNMDLQDMAARCYKNAINIVEKGGLE